MIFVDRLRSSLFCLTILFALVVSGLSRPVKGAGRSDTGVRNLVQMPLAVSKLRRAGVPESNLKTMVQSLNRAGVPPGEVNLLLFTMPLFAEDMGSLDAVSNFTLMQYERGLSGSRLVSVMRRELRNRGLLVEPPMPASDSYVTSRLRKVITTVKRRRLERRRRDDPPEQSRGDQNRSQDNQPARPPTPTGPTGPSGPGGFP